MAGATNATSVLRNYLIFDHWSLSIFGVVSVRFSAGTHGSEAIAQSLSQLSFT